MARRARGEMLYDGCYAHVFSRSIERRRIFTGEADFRSFKELLMRAKAEGGFSIFHYCLMHTHFHLAIGIDRVERFSRGMQQVKWRYTREYNLKNKRWGPLWRERFKSMLIEDERYLYACGKYIEENPVKAGLVEEGADWEYSSARFYEGRGSDELLAPYAQQEMPEDVDLSDESEFEHGWIIGSGGFKYKMIKGKA